MRFMKVACMLLYVCVLGDRTRGVLCFTHRNIVQRPSQQSSPPWASEFRNKPLTHRLLEDEAFIVSPSYQEVNVFEIAISKINGMERYFQDFMSKKGMNRLRDGGPEVMQDRFRQLQPLGIMSAVQQQQAQVQQAQVQTEILRVLKKHRWLTRVNDMDRNLVPHRVFGMGSESRRVMWPVDESVMLVPGCKIPPEPRCGKDWKLRSFSGKCNNLRKPNRGRAMTAFSRFFPARYEDGIWEPVTKGVLEGRLPSPRLVSATVVDTSPRQDSIRTLSVMLFAQFINHDMISTMSHPASSATGGLFCCNKDNTLPRQPLHPEACMPIEIPRNDPFYSRFRHTCMSQVRSARAPCEHCIAGPMKQLNQVSQYLDASNVYGSGKEAADRLRSFIDGRLNASEGNLLPEVNGRFVSGEARFSENPGLTFMHTVWTREHNRVAEELRSLHPTWTDEDLYQRARRIVIAEYQHIVYDELLPAILGSDFTSKHGLRPEDGYSFLYYSADVDARISGEFSTAAFRFGHSQIHDAFIPKRDADRFRKEMPLEETFFKTNFLKERGFMDQMARSLTDPMPRSVDTTFSASVHERLFSGGRDNPGLDLVALNINRGRDHGLPGYITVLENCQGRLVGKYWEELEEFIDPVSLKRLQNVYTSVEDIDLYIGGISERPVPGSLVGPTFQCIIGQQFFNTRYGDRFFYNNPGQPTSFTVEQLFQIQKTSWARVLCDNIPELKTVQPFAFWQQMDSNYLIPCKSRSIPAVSFNPF